jgi:hypothetical protein
VRGNEKCRHWLSRRDGDGGCLVCSVWLPFVRGDDMTATGLACGSCGTGLRAGDKFCHECAAPVVGASKPAEYKQVTVGENAWLRGAYRVGRGNAMIAVVPLLIPDFGHHGPACLERQRLTLLRDISCDPAPTQPEGRTRLRRVSLACT